mmetsp:Transcript_76215/g.210305  ORF Transcript_76215/g.210305 Transcript_76215/m.210305 type:complete len:394 (-) Transcript_76215:139-1320(-)
MGVRRGALLAAVLLRAAAQLPPGLAPSWSANVSCAPFPLTGEWHMDLRPKAPRYRQIEHMPSIALGAKVPYTWDILKQDALALTAPDVTYGDTGDDVCAPSSWPAVNVSDVFVQAVTMTGLRWKSAGSVVVEGTRCRLWRVAGQPWWSVCVAADGSPRRFSSGWLTCQVSDVRVGPIPDAVFAPSKACQTYPAQPCPNASIVNLTLYRLHDGSEPLAIENRDLGDALGAPTIVCEWPKSGDEYVTAWAVQASAAWGQYGRCHFNGTNFCDAQTGKQVGRQSPQGLAGVPLQGQCSGNGDRGSWYSFPAEGQCRRGEPLGSRGCTWIARPLRTVHASCLVRRGLMRACKREVGHGFHMPRSAAVIERALATGDRSRGGCPDASPGGQASSVLVV